MFVLKNKLLIRISKTAAFATTFFILFTCKLFSQTYNFVGGNDYRVGPTQAWLNSSYTMTNLQGSVTASPEGIQSWTIPVTGIYRITARGACGAPMHAYTGGN